MHIFSVSVKTRLSRNKQRDNTSTNDYSKGICFSCCHCCCCCHYYYRYYCCCCCYYYYCYYYYYYYYYCRFFIFYYTKWSMIPACPGLMCSFNRGDIEGTSSSKICV